MTASFFQPSSTPSVARALPQTVEHVRAILGAVHNLHLPLGSLLDLHTELSGGDGRHRDMLRGFLGDSALAMDQVRRAVVHDPDARDDKAGIAAALHLAQRAVRDPAVLFRAPDHQILYTYAAVTGYRATFGNGTELANLARAMDDRKFVNVAYDLAFSPDLLVGAVREMSQRWPPAMAAVTERADYRFQNWDAEDVKACAPLFGGRATDPDRLRGLLDSLVERTGKEYTFIRDVASTSSPIDLDFRSLLQRAMQLPHAVVLAAHPRNKDAGDFYLREVARDLGSDPDNVCSAVRIAARAQDPAAALSRVVGLVYQSSTELQLLAQPAGKLVAGGGVSVPDAARRPVTADRPPVPTP